MMLAVIALLAALTPCFAENYPEAGQALPWTGLEAGARAGGMAGALCADSADAFALFRNPAGMSGGSGFRGAVSHTAFVLGIRAEDFAADRSVAEGRIGIAIRYVDLGHETQRTIFGIEGPVFGATGLSAALGYARAGLFAGRVRAGAAVKLLSADTFYSNQATGAVDAGLIAGFLRGDAGDEPVRLGVSVMDLGPGIGAAGLATRLRLGGAASTVKNAGRGDGVTGALDLEFSLQGTASLHAGAEYAFGGFAFGRVGYARSLWSEGAGGFCAGAGLRAGGFQLDYSYSAVGNLGGAHRVGVTYARLPVP